MVEEDPAALWAGPFGDAYLERNSSPAARAASLRLLAAALGGECVSSALELGANIGLNLESIACLYPAASRTAVEINTRAVAHLRSQGIETIQGSLLDVEIGKGFDLVLTVGVLIHIQPSRLPDAYRQIYDAADRLILIAEYYSPNPVEVPYRDLNGAMWKRDFAGELLDLYPDLRLIRFGATYHRWARGDDDLTWFVLEKPQSKPRSGANG